MGPRRGGQEPRLHTAKDQLSAAKQLIRLLSRELVAALRLHLVDEGVKLMEGRSGPPPRKGVFGRIELGQQALFGPLGEREAGGGGDQLGDRGDRVNGHVHRRGTGGGVRGLLAGDHDDGVLWPQVRG